jgi:hypothetical protein
MSGELSAEVSRAIETLFVGQDRVRAEALLAEDWGGSVRELYRCRLAALKYSDGDLSKLERAVDLGRRDYRDLLVAAGFGNDVRAHLKWRPKPAGEPSEIDAVRLAEGIHERVRAALAPIGFGRHGDEWRRYKEVRQALRLLTGLTNRVETRFFLRLTLDAEPKGVMLQLPRLPRGVAKFSGEQGYIFHAGGDEGVLYGAAASDLDRYAKPWFERFTTHAEMERDFGDGTFGGHLIVERRAVVF